jgi:hypothetical protein
MNQKESFAKTGTAYIKNVLSEDLRKRFVDLMFQMKADGLARHEGGADSFYTESFGGNHAEFEDALRLVQPAIEAELGVQMKPANSFARIYCNGGTLKPHMDREGLDYTLSITLRHNLDFQWPLWVIDNEGQTQYFNIKEGDGAMVLGRTQTHWRNNLFCRADQHSVQLFMHWSKV